MNLLRNPEFIRNTWLELTPQRLLAMPAILGLIFAACYFSPGGQVFLPKVALFLFAAITGVWGSKLASETLSDEIGQGTWDTQRLSGLSAWQMTTGKLFGGPIFAWLGGALCATVYLVFEPAGLDASALKILLVAVGVAVTLHALALLSSLIALRKLPRQAQRPRTRTASLLLLLILLPQLGGLIFNAPQLADVVWYGHSFGATDFALLCTALAVFWSVYGLYRSMREELAFRDPPTAWIAFMLFLYVFSGGWFYGAAGFSDPPFAEQDLVVLHTGICVLFTWAVVYFLLFTERKEWLRLRRLAALWTAGERRRAFTLMPKWLVTLVLAALSALVFSLAALLKQRPMEGIADTSVAIAFIALLVRDSALVLGLNFTTQQRRSDAAAGLYLAVLYVLIPLLLEVLKLSVLLPVFLPPLVHQQPVWLVAVLFQAALALEFARNRWNKLP